MNSDFFTEGYAHAAHELAEIEDRLLTLRHELTHAQDETTGRSDKQVRDEIEALEKKKQSLHLKLEHEENENKQ